MASIPLSTLLLSVSWECAHGLLFLHEPQLFLELHLSSSSDPRLECVAVGLKLADRI